MLTLNSISKLGFTLILIAAFFSVGFHHPDEYYYSINFAYAKLGLIPYDSWEYDTRIRPWSLPAIFYILIQFLALLGIKNPFSIMLILRCLSGLVSWAAITFLLKSLKRHLPKKQHHFLSFLFYFNFIFVYMSVRTSSDNWSNIFILLALGAYFSNYHQRLLAIGLFLGMSFNMRFQTGFISLGCVLWLLKETRSIKTLIPLFTGLLITVFLGGVIDSWGYGEWTLTPWNYFYQNLVLNKVNSFGRYPFYQYFWWTLTNFTPLLGAPLLFFSLKYLVNNPKSLISYCSLPFLAFHMLIGHKELRFLYPILSLAMLAFTIEVFRHHRKQILFKLMAVTNFILLLGVLFRPAYRPIIFYQKLWNFVNDHNNTSLVTVLEDEDRPHQFELKAFLHPGLKLQYASVIQKGYLFANAPKTREQMQQNQSRCSLAISSYPSWLIKYNFFNWTQRSNIWQLYDCNY